MTQLLPNIPDRITYNKLFRQNRPWQDAINFLIKKHKLQGEVSRGELGSHIVYRVGASWLKLMAPIFAHDMPFEISGLKAVEDQLPVETPKVLGCGEIEDWEYVILSHIDGEPIKTAWKNFSEIEQENLTDQIASCLNAIYQCSFDKLIEGRFHWNQFIEDRYNNCLEFQTKKGLPKPWLDKLEKFVQGFELKEFQTEHSVLIHADLTHDHFLVRSKPEVLISGIIDFADCQVGHKEYELIAPCIFILISNAKLLRKLLLGVGVSENHINQRFSQKLLLWSILHRYFGFAEYFKDEMEQVDEGDFEALAKIIFPL